MEERGGEEIASVQVCVTGQYIEGQSPTNALTHMHTHTHTHAHTHTHSYSATLSFPAVPARQADRDFVSSSENE